MTKIFVQGSGGGSKQSSQPYVPVESANSAGANTYAKLVDLLCEGEIGGPAVGDSWYKSTYYNEIPVMNPDGSLNYSGVTLDGRVGTHTQEYLGGFNGIEGEVEVNAPVIYGHPISRTISDADVDSCKVAISIPTLLYQADNGDVRSTSLYLSITVTPDNGLGTAYVAVSPSGNGLITGKYTSPYRKQFLLENLHQYGAAPWVITVERYIADSSSLKLVNAFSWYSYTTIIDTKLRYYRRAVVGMTINSQEFGNQIPSRAYRIHGIKCKIPSNYNPVLHTYSGDWDGTFITATTNNIAWIVYYLLTDPENGLGETITEDMVDKWALYACAVYNDGTISVTQRVRQADGSYSNVVISEPRFTFNGVIEARAQGLEAITQVCGAMRAYPIWVGGQVSFIQDRPVVAPARPVGLSNVSEDGFIYTGIPRRNRHTVVKVSWNDPELLGKLDIIELVDEESIINFGYNEVDFVAFGCTSRTEAIRRGKYVLDTDINAREMVSFIGGLEWADALPGDLLAVQDPNYAAITLEGRVKSATTTSLVLDKEILLEAGATHTMLVQTADGPAEERELTNFPETTDTLTWATPLDVAPFTGAQLVISTSNVSTRKFSIVSVSEDEGAYTVSGVEYDADKYARIDAGVVSDLPVNTALLPRILTPPTNLALESFTYTAGDQQIRFFGLSISWTPSLDPRVSQYQVRWRSSSEGWKHLHTTTDNSFNWQPLAGDTYDISVRGTGVGISSEWVTWTDFFLDTTLTNLAQPTGVDTKEGGGLWSGRDCTINWTPSVGSQYPSNYGDDDVGASNVDHYKVVVMESDTTHLRTYDTPKGATEYTYFHSFNASDNTLPIRDLLFFVHAVDVFGQASTLYDSVAASNPAPDFTGYSPMLIPLYEAIQVDWSAFMPTDPDLHYFEIRCDIVSPPVTVVGKAPAEQLNYTIDNLDPKLTYFIEVIPWDEFGPGGASNVGSAIPLEMGGSGTASEIAQSVAISDSEANLIATMREVYDRVYSSGGPVYDRTGTPADDFWVEFDYGVGFMIDTVQPYLNISGARVYAAIDTDGQGIWRWFGATSSSDHGLTNKELLEKSDQATARDAYWELISGGNFGLLPPRVPGKKCRLYFTGSGLANSHQLHELRFDRQVHAEQIYAENLAAISTDFGAMKAGSVDIGPKIGMNPVGAQFKINADGTFLLQTAQSGNYIIYGSTSMQVFQNNLLVAEFGELS